MKRLGLIGETLVHKFIYLGHSNGFDQDEMKQWIIGKKSGVSIRFKTLRQRGYG